MSLRRLIASLAGSVGLAAFLVAGAGLTTAGDGGYAEGAPLNADKSWC
jgi:hypothetical protein